MDKNTYETYEFLPASSNEADTDQFVVVQDDGTFLCKYYFSICHK